MNNKLKCYVCSNVGKEGIILLNKYICRKCELDLLKASLDEFNYKKIKRGIKYIWGNSHKKHKLEAY